MPTRTKSTSIKSTVLEATEPVYHEAIPVPASEVISKDAAELVCPTSLQKKLGNDVSSSLQSAAAVADEASAKPRRGRPKRVRALVPLAKKRKRVET